MPKPWAKYDVGWINHDKFRAINAEAIGLWVEGKDYADARHTDGMLPAFEVRHWRFYSKRNVALLTTSIGNKPGSTEVYAALWEEVVGVGYRMHDYLDWNDCRDKVIQRIFEGQIKQKQDRDRKAAWRAQKDAKKKKSA